MRLALHMDHLIFLKALWAGTADTANDRTTPGGATHVLMYVNGASWSCAVQTPQPYVTVLTFINPTLQMRKLRVIKREGRKI